MKKVQIGARISQEDAEFISQLKIEGANTPSDKLRAIIENAKKKSEVPYDFTSSYRTIKEELDPIIEYVKETEHTQGNHSAVLARILEWMPDFYAFCLSALNPDSDRDNNLIKFEKGATDRVFRLFESLLHLELSKQQTSYTPHAIRNHLESLEQLTQIINSTPKDKGGLN
ncbi:MAG: hypothetical protein KKD01_10160 [Proteobacteria bacterium]|nr:hypothetical protein [Pseudomonadota bacterium]MBU1138326.1 hypothetical protein [Pseudomonadota bacterium]MBU1231973.1 hypothetical protein [Pseudomonadota bacterium]MBU1418996.1 hypothetical protein [Pseudomonadota bacterium]MBU1455076.1 hypothetical protein [Pseudomonadota bacterium]